MKNRQLIKTLLDQDLDAEVKMRIADQPLVTVDDLRQTTDPDDEAAGPVICLETSI